MLITMKLRQYIPDHAVTTIPALAVLFAMHYFLVRDEAVDAGIEATVGAPAYYDHWQRDGDPGDFDIDAELTRLQLEDGARDQLIREWLQRGEYKRARTGLLQIAASAVAKNDQERLADTLLLLGEVAIEQQELSTAEVYLQEALYLAMEQDNLLATARSYQLLGQLNIRARELARRAANTYDELWQARNSISRGFYQGVNERLRAVISENLEIRRYGAAADAWEAMAALHEQVHDSYQAQQARIEAAKLFASTGQLNHVRRLLDGLDRGLISAIDVAVIEAEIDTLWQRYRTDLINTSQARDYQVLYHHYLRVGEVDRAWQFRIKSSETLAETSDRAMYQRQADIIAVLYNSNFAMDRAKQYLDQAGGIYDGHGLADEREQTREMEALIY